MDPAASYMGLQRQDSPTAPLPPNHPLSSGIRQLGQKLPFQLPLVHHSKVSSMILLIKIQYSKSIVDQVQLLSPVNTLVWKLLQWLRENLICFWTQNLSCFNTNGFPRKCLPGVSTSATVFSSNTPERSVVLPAQIPWCVQLSSCARIKHLTNNRETDFGMELESLQVCNYQSIYWKL